MSLVTPAVYSGQLVRFVAPGDVMAGGDVISANATVGAATIAANSLLTGILNRTGSTAGFADTLPTAANLLVALAAAQYLASGAITPSGVQNGTTFRVRYINAVAFVDTITAPDTSVTLGANTAIAASSVKDLLFTITNGTPQQIVSGSTTNASAVVTGLTSAQTNLLTPGMLVTGTGIPASATIASVQPGVGFTLSANATATNALVALTASPTYRVDSLGQMLL